MALFAPVNDIAHNIQLAVAPVFLLTGIGSILNVLAARLGRVTDRARKLEAEIPGYPSTRRQEALQQLGILDRRMAATHRAIALCTLSALLVCIVVAILFIGDLMPMRWTGIVAVLFILAMLLLIAGLMLFLYEVQIALKSVRVKAALLGKGLPGD
ncbi:MAG: hypothetical protein CFE37_10875 [Alphaproteobacteria bacterium PA4]|nr:MAG: hypothetical protein CFE37_10875 [Alphaproteobacteria bacterium PA4]